MSEQKKMKFRKPIIFFGFPKNEFLFKEIKSILYKNQKIKANQIIIILSYSENGQFSNMTMLQQEFDAWGLPSLRPYLKYLIDNGVAELKLVQWGKCHRWAVIIGSKKYQYKGGHEFNKSLKIKLCYYI